MSDQRKTDLSKFNNDWFKRGASIPTTLMWYLFKTAFFISYWNLFSGLKVFLLRLFGAKIGRGVVIKQGVNIKSIQTLMGHSSIITTSIYVDDNPFLLANVSRNLKI